MIGRGDWESDVIRAISASAKRKILMLLARRPYTLKELSEELGISPPAILKQIKELESLGIIDSSTIQGLPGRPRRVYRLSKSIMISVTLTRGMVTYRTVEVSPNVEVHYDAIVDKVREIEEKVRSLDEVPTYHDLIIVSSDILKEIEKTISELDRIKIRLIWLREQILNKLKEA